MTSTPCGRPSEFGLVTITWIARTRMPLALLPEQGGALPPSQVCSLRVTEPIPGTRMVVFGGGLSLTAVPATESPRRLVPRASDEDLPQPEPLLACEIIASAEAVHVPPLGKTQIPCPLATLEEVLLDARTAPAVSLTDVPLLTNDVLSWSRS